MARPVLLKNRSELIRHAFRRLKNPKTKRVQEYVLSNFGIQVSQCLVCNVRKEMESDPEDFKADRNSKLLSMLINTYGGLDNMIDMLHEMQEVEVN